MICLDSAKGRDNVNHSCVIVSNIKQKASAPNNFCMLFSIMAHLPSSAHSLPQEYRIAS